MNLKIVRWGLLAIAMLIAIVGSYLLADTRARARHLRENLLVCWPIEKNLESGDYRTLKMNVDAIATTYFSAYERLPALARVSLQGYNDEEKLDDLKSRLEAQSDGTGR